MATVPTLDTFTAGEVVTAAKLNKNIRDTGNFLVTRPMCQLSANAAQSIANSSYTIAVMSVTDVDTDNMADLANNRIVIKTAGLYRVCGTAFWSSNATGVRYAAVRDASGAVGTGSFYSFSSVPGGTSGTAASGVRFQRFAVNDTFRLELWQNSGGALSTGTPYNLTNVSAEWVAP